MWLLIQILISIKLCYQNVSEARMQATDLNIIFIILIPEKVSNEYHYMQSDKNSFSII